MEIKVRLSDIVNAQGALNELGTQRLVARAGLQIGRALRVVSAELETFNKTRQVLIEKHGGIANPQTNRYDFKDEAAFNREFQDLLATEITLSVDKIKVDDLADCKIQIATMLALTWLIDDTEPIPEQK